jgi:hypothetical protein
VSSRSKVAADVLRRRQRVDLVVVGDVVAEIELLRRLEDQELVVAERGRIPFSSALRRPEQVVEARSVPRQAGAPVEVAALDVDVTLLLARQALAGRVGGGDAEVGEADRVADVDVIADPGRLLVPLQHRKGVEQLHLLERPIDTRRLDLRFVVDAARRRHLPGGDDRMPRRDFRAEKGDRADVIDRARLDDRRA